MADAAGGHREDIAQIVAALDWVPVQKLTRKANR